MTKSSTCASRQVFMHVCVYVRAHAQRYQHVLKFALSEPGICHRNEDSHGSENQKSCKNIFSMKKIDKHTIFYDK